MPKNRIIIGIGVVIALLPVFGFPHFWESIFQVLAGIAIVLLSVWANIDKKLTLKAKAHKRQIQRRQMVEMQREVDKEVTDEREP